MLALLRRCDPGCVCGMGVQGVVGVRLIVQVWSRLCLWYGCAGCGRC